MSTQTLRLALQQGLFPFGVAIKTSPNRYTYAIFEKRLEKYLEGTDYEKQASPWSVDCSNSDELRS